MKRIAPLLLATLLLPGVAFAQRVYKCTLNGKEVFQDSICPPEAASAAVRVFPSKWGNSVPGMESDSTKNEELRALKQEMARMGGPGATAEQVTKKMGKPSEIRTKIVDGEIFEEWTYANGSVVKFKGTRVVSVETVRKVSP